MVRIINSLETHLIGIYLEHKKVVDEREPKYELCEELFAINEPFYMNSEKEALIRDTTDSERKTNKQNKRYKRLINKKHIYDSLLSEPQKTVINEVINDSKHLIQQSVINSDNSSAERMARIGITTNDLTDYSNKLLCNQNDSSLVFNDFIIPAKCSLMCCDVMHGLRVLTDHYKRSQLQVSDNFLVVMDPPWANKSVKRKRSYQTEHNRNILQMTRCLDSLLKLFPKHINTRICIWSTHKEKDFVINQMLPNLNCKLTHLLLWHKITTKGESCKLRGSLEYLIIASNQCQSGQHLEGVLVSIPSAIHSHKPPLNQLIDHLFGESSVSTDDNSDPPVVRSAGGESEPNCDDRNQCLTESINSRINGLELYARYLTFGFHSIGYECLKLQNCNLFAIRNK